MTATEQLMHEHADLEKGIQAIREVGELIDEVGAELAKRETARVLEFLRNDLLPHARREEEHLYPEVARVMGAPEATRTMMRDHVEVELLTRQLERAVEEDDFRAMRQLLFGLHHLVRVHFAKEEEIYLPLLEDRLTESEAKALAERMHAA